MLLVLGLSALSIYLYLNYGKLKESSDKLTAEFNGLEKQYLGTVDIMKQDGEKNTAEKQSVKYDSYTLLSKCGMGMYIPNEKYRYDPFSALGVIDGVNRAWRLHGEKILKTETTNTDPFIDGYRYYSLLRNDNEASGYVAGYVSVECKDNTEGLTTEAFTTKYLDYAKKWNKESEAVSGVKANSLVVKKNETLNKWGIDVNKVTIQKSSIAEMSTENGYIFTYGNRMYYVYSYGLSTDKKAVKMMNSMIESIYLYK